MNISRKLRNDPSQPKNKFSRVLSCFELTGRQHSVHGVGAELSLISKDAEK